MKINLHPPQSLNEIGQRENNEDSIWPLQEDLRPESEHRLFMVCDGVGGLKKGEVASEITCRVISDYLLGKETVDADDIDKAVHLAENRINKRMTELGESTGIATTLTLLHFGREKVTAAHLGDSRIYQFRNGDIIFKTEDHSFVNELVAKGIINEAEARTHPKRNVVTKAVTGRGSHEKTEIRFIIDVKKDDLFFMCSDGVCESLTDRDLQTVLGGTRLSDSDKMQRIREECERNSKDNFSAWLLHVGEVGGKREIRVHGFLEENRRKIFTAATGIFLLFLVFAAAGALTTKNTDKPTEVRSKSPSEILDEIEPAEIEMPVSESKVLLPADTFSASPALFDTLKSKQEIPIK